jgi:arsenate reductase (thioredoxin)
MTRRRDLIRVIVLDRENALRSQMAEAFLRRIGSDRLEVVSAGIALQPLHALTRIVMGECGYDLAGHEPKSAQLFFGRGAFHVAILVSRADERQCPRLFPGALAIVRWAIADPLAGSLDRREQLDRFREVRNHIREHAEAWWSDCAASMQDAESSRLLMAIGH